MDASALLHMNEDHADALLDYARHFGNPPADYAASRAQLTPNTKQTSLEISYRSGIDNKQKLTSVPLVLREGISIRARLIEMATEASVARVPAFEPAPLRLSAFLLASLTVLGVVAHAPRAALARAPAAALWRAAGAAMDLVGGAAVGRLLFYAAVVAHAGEGAYVCWRLRAAMKRKNGRGWARVAAWALQTLLFGFPSLLLVTEKLRKAEDAQGDTKVD